jgi:hypothetical protein
MSESHPGHAELMMAGRLRLTGHLRSRPDIAGTPALFRRERRKGGRTGALSSAAPQPLLTEGGFEMAC